MRYHKWKRDLDDLTLYVCEICGSEVTLEAGRKAFQSSCYTKNEKARESRMPKEEYKREQLKSLSEYIRNGRG